MPLESINELMRRARAGSYAVGYFESWNLESLQGTLDAAEETASPIIIGFNGEFLSRPDREGEERLAWYGALGRTAAESARVPCGFLFNECSRDQWTRQAVTKGFNMVMPADSEASLEDYTTRAATLTRYAHEHDVSVEVEAGELPCGATGRIEGGGSLTDVESAAQLIEVTKADLLAVSVGNVHILVNGDQELDLDQLEAIQTRVPVPLALHGGTGISREALRQAIARGVFKVNFGTYIKQRYLAALHEALRDPSINPHTLLGGGGEKDMQAACRRAVREAVLERLHWLNCCGQA